MKRRDWLDWRQFAPTFAELEYYARLEAGVFTLDQTLRAHTQDLARSIRSRGLREIQLASLADACSRRLVSRNGAAGLRATIEDELPGPNRVSHFDVRAQMFVEAGFSYRQLEGVVVLDRTAAAIGLFREIFEGGTLLQMTAAVGAIEAWYVPVAARLEQLYLELGYSPAQVATYTLHKHADVDHSATALAFVEHHATETDVAGIEAAIECGFRSVRLFDEGRLDAATRSIELADLFTTRQGK